jgi:hypothetical protein
MSGPFSFLAKVVFDREGDKEELDEMVFDRVVWQENNSELRVKHGVWGRQ